MMKEIFLHSADVQLTKPLATSWLAPSNIAFIKYWGKKEVQLPVNASLSMTLQNALTTTSLQAVPADKRSVSFFFEGSERPDFLSKIETFFQRISNYIPWINNAAFTIKSSNSFPHSAGIASSASAMAALALALADADAQLTGQPLDDTFYRKASFLARLASGSAARSVYGGYAAWGSHAHLSSSSDEYAVAINEAVHPRFKQMHDDILLINKQPKAISSSAGHQLMQQHPFLQGRISQANKNFERLCYAMTQGDLDVFAEIVENEAFTLHALMMSSEKSFSLLHPNTLLAIHEIRAFRKQTGIPLCFTLDAGPNVHLIYPEMYYDKVKPFVTESLTRLCTGETILYDNIGKGPRKIEKEI
jgi:diphosphomevalonate decarboxylase